MPPSAFDDEVDDAVGYRQIRFEQAANDNQRNEMREIADRLHNGAEAFTLDLVEHDCKNNRNGKTEKDVVKADRKRIENQPGAVRRLEEDFEMLQPNPFARRKALERVIILECDQVAPHERVAEENIINQTRSDKRQRDQPLAAGPGILIPARPFPGHGYARHMHILRF